MIFEMTINRNNLNLKISVIFENVTSVFDWNTLSRQVSSNDYPVLENKVKAIVKEKQPFERLVVTKENLLKMFEVT